jgi:hypothetical protein
MSIRSNKTEPENKIAQGFNLAIKFNGIAKWLILNTKNLKTNNK